MTKLVLALIKFYQKYFSWLNGPAVCRFHPRCSQYCFDAIQKYGLNKGTWLGINRIRRCHPFSLGGVDLVK